MPKIAIVTGVLLFILGPIFFFIAPTGHQSPTAFIPSLFRIFIAGSGAAALSPARTKAAMHAAAMFGLLGLLGALSRGLKPWIAFLSGNGEMGLGPTSQFLMFIICLVFIVLCVRWFISNRKARLAA